LSAWVPAKNTFKKHTLPAKVPAEIAFQNKPRHRLLHCKKGLAVFPSPAGMSLIENKASQEFTQKSPRNPKQHQKSEFRTKRNQNSQ
jgi:hypothetical protein